MKKLVNLRNVKLYHVTVWGPYMEPEDYGEMNLEEFLNFAIEQADEGRTVQGFLDPDGEGPYIASYTGVYMPSGRLGMAFGIKE